MQQRVVLVVGLGNPGRTYAGTRHNVGAAFVRELARSGAWSAVRGAEAEAARWDVGEVAAWCVVPGTFMNVSGTAVARAARELGVRDRGDVLVVHDEMEKDVGKVAVKLGGSAGGHNGFVRVFPVDDAWRETDDGA